MVGFILLPLITKKLSVSEFGVYVRIDALWQILLSLILFGIENGVIFWYLGIENEKQRKRFLFSVTLFIFALSLAFSLFFLVFSKSFSLLIFSDINTSTLVFYSSLIASMEAIIFLIFLLIRIQEKSVLYTVISILLSISGLLLQYYFLIYTQEKLEGIFLAKILSPALFILLLIPFYKKYVSAGIELSLLKKLIIFSFPVMIASLLGTFLNQIDRYILGYLTNSYQVGIYGLGNYICGVISILLIGPFSLAFSVISWKKYKDDNAKRFFSKSVTYLYFIVIFSSIFISLFTPNVIKVLTTNTDYWAAKNIVPWIAISIPLYGITNISFFSFYPTKNTSYLILFYAIALLSKIGFDFLLIPYYNMYGAAVANYLSFFILIIITYYYSKKQYFFSYEWIKISVMTLLFIFLVFPFFYFNFNSRLIELTLKTIAFISFPLWLYLFKQYEPIEIERVKGFANKYYSIILKKVYNSK